MLSVAVSQPDAVIFVGSGISRWAGLPSWSELIEELAQYLQRNGVDASLVRTEASRGDLLQAASYGFDQLTKPQIGEFIRGACRTGVAFPQEVHRLVTSLGPRCFITTNYDPLIEAALRQWQSDRFYRVVTNRHLTETAEIVHARAIDFVFKPHGDAADSESIVLTREQYRELLPQGERHSALEALKTLLVSRPILYVGFGLRDPDFIFVKDLIFNTYKGGARDHYAIIPDLDELEIGYWRKNYGIHITSYQSVESNNPGVAHAGLLSILNDLASGVARRSPSGFNTSSANTLLTLARYAAALENIVRVESPELPIRVTSLSKAPQRAHRFDRFDYSPVERLVDEISGTAVLTGLPGAGKTYALRRAVVRFAEKLRGQCLSASFDPSDATIPVYVDLKLYGGSLHRLITDSLPPSIDFLDLHDHFGVRVYADSFNEMPKEYWENGLYEQDFKAFLESFVNISFIVGSRTTDGLDKFGFPAYSLDQIDQEVVANHMAQAGVDISGRFKREIVEMLQKPFFFKLVIDGLVKLPSAPHPRDIYSSLLSNIQSSFESRFDTSVSLECVLCEVAFAAMDRGEEAFPLSELLSLLRNGLASVGVESLANEVANWLVSKQLLIPYSGARVAFIHQSVTEYLAATELARRYVLVPAVLRERVILRRWDQALFLTLSMLNDLDASRFIRDVIDADIEMALTAVKYVEQGRDELVSRILEVIAGRDEDLDFSEKSNIAMLLAWSLPVTAQHAKKLREIMVTGDMLGAAAAQKLVEIEGVKVKCELIELLVKRPGDYNLGANGIGRALRDIAEEADVRMFRNAVNDLSFDLPFDIDDCHGFTSAVSEALADVDFGVVREAFFPAAVETPEQCVCAEIISGITKGDKSHPSVRASVDLLAIGWPGAVFALSLGANKIDADSWKLFGSEHIDILISSIVSKDENAGWALRLLSRLSDAGRDASMHIARALPRASAVPRVALLSILEPNDESQVEELLRSLVREGTRDFSAADYNILSEISFSWRGRESLFVELCRLGDSKLLYYLCDWVEIYGYHEQENVGVLDVGDIEFWLAWMKAERDPMFWDRLSSMFSSRITKEKRKEFLDEFNRPNSAYRDVLSKAVLLQQPDLSTDDFSSDAISYLLAELRRDGWPYGFRGSLLGATATERFVQQNLLPLVRDANGLVLRNVRLVLSEAGKRHGRRYLEV